ncbi:PQQ-dependent sugar dehydrogenase [Elizabethkingia meningoseptica]|uniref:PQQ-dependent sugar dehydrogenase n=1 Tax=Elizabethkingia meningoseptica TaxID=238 RepID=UPI0022F1A9CA|nr:PQQ-dependent sugar dehydrogenase [Elizabethkingia meningoseptica]EJK5327462.1 PQQ-dependent sugar dehydrogenase [Elizabethkingia meningoseptica]MDE5467097.1 PQQ-dependent sugar dehydrogenase [Elizabethkingia meningoseptica]MDE5473673.1 PQQ-dependent sugar dehydrogenase [Elizabethkingia meningoseptica]MDE5477106.1 PQQ-dependent sugar dehydrogenase [Elizabethkingia meningoseptica]MDE5484416.1 PQQ-dependent sugar dehydrogenase [Elizabethkingia meningoseptica]
MKTLIIAAALSVSGCHDKAQDTIVPGKSVETEKPNTNYKPAFEGQTRIQGIKTATALNVEEIVSGLSKPWGIVVLNDGRLLITEKTGTLRIVDKANKLSQPVTGLPEVNSNGQGGLLDIVADPDFAQNRMLYWVFSERKDGKNATVVAKGKLANDEKTVENTQVIYRAEPAYDGTLHYGGRIIFDKDGNLFVSTGERSDLVTRPQAQQLNSALGKVLKITKDGKSAPGNPFAGRNDVRPEIYSYGHRNIQGLALHPETGDLWEGEFGPRGGDEINIIKPGKNYGWPIITYGIEYDGKTIGDGITQKEGMEQPVYYWDPVISPSGMIFYSGDVIPEWKNNLLIACLSGQHIDRLDIKNNKIAGEERLLGDKNERFRDLAQGLNGEIYAVTDSGKVFRISKK